MLNDSLEFHQWVFRVCEKLKETKFRGKELEYIYSFLNLTDAKLSYMDGESEEEYALSFRH